MTFAPHTAGAKNARLAITSNGPDSPDAAPLNGSATAPPAPRTAPVTTTSPAATRPGEPVAPARTKPAARGGSKLELDALRISKHINLRAARRKGLSVAAFVPEGTRFVKIRLTSKGRVIARTVTKVGADNVVTIALPTSPKGRRNLKRGAYTIEVTPGPRAGDYGVTTRRTIRIV